VKVRNPKSRNHLDIKSADYVLEVGGGHNPHPRSNMIVDKFIDSNYHRNGDIKVYKNQKFLSADGENLPFKNNEFDYVICNQVLEHVENPAKFLDEQSRVAKRGFIEVPSLIGEHLFPKISHKWLILEIDNALVLVEKEKVGFKTMCDFGDFFLDYLPKRSIGYKILQRTHPYIETTRYEWENKIDYVINPTDPEILKYFTTPWNMDTINKFIPKKSLGSEVISMVTAMADIIRSMVKSKLIKRFSNKNDYKTTLQESKSYL